MKSKSVDASASPLAAVLPGFQFSEEHSGVIDAPPEEVWEVLRHLGWADLRIGRPLMALRGTRPGPGSIVATFTDRAGAVLVEDPPSTLLLAMIGKPWSLVPRSIPATSLAEVRGYTGAGWLKYGMEWLVHPVPGGRSLVETRTLCEATDERARRAFGLYWIAIRAGSGLIRRDMIGAVRRIAEGR